MQKSRTIIIKNKKRILEKDIKFLQKLYEISMAQTMESTNESTTDFFFKQAERLQRKLKSKEKELSELTNKKGRK